MPMPEMFKKFSSKKNASEGSPATDVPANETRDIPNPIAATSDNTIPALSDNMKKAWAATHRELPQAQGVEKVLNKMEEAQDALTLSPGQQALVDTLATPVKALMDTTNISEAIHKGVDTFMEAVPPLMRALDQVAKIHPFIGVVVLAFKVVYTLEKKRTDNDKRVVALDAEMKDMMEVLLNLNGIPGPKTVGRDGRTIEDRMQKLCEESAKDIDECAEACDTYLARKFIYKVVGGFVWEERLVKFVGIFAKKRERFQFTISVNTLVTVTIIDERTAEISRKMEVMLQVFQELLPPKQRVLAAKAREIGSDAVLEDEQLVKELLAVESTPNSSPGPEGQPGGDRPPGLDELRKEIKRDPDEVIKMNSEFFNLKYGIQKREIETMARLITRDGDRVIEAITAGPHDRIVDPDIYNVWKSMGWRGSVETRQFVTALKDYYVEKASKDSGSITGPDSWALKYINLGRMRSIPEAFDDDVSGFVTVNEVNAFTRSRPLGWSLPHWIAYWAIGWQMTCTTYCVKIEEIFEAMISLSDQVLPENRQAARGYIDEVWKQVTTFVQSIEREEGTEQLRCKFESHVAAEESRLGRNFEDINYRINGSDTVRVVSGEGRLETTLFPMLYLVLKRGLEKLSLARKYVFCEGELLEDRAVVFHVITVAMDRVKELKTIFKQQNLEAKDQFEIFAKGLYNTAHMPGALFSGENLRGLQYPIPCRDEIIPDPDSVPLSVLHYSTKERCRVDFSAYDPPEPTPPPAEGTHPVLGVYYGMIYGEGSAPNPMMKLTFSKGEDEATFVAAGVYHLGGNYRDCKFVGSWGLPLEDGTIPVEMKIDDQVPLKGTFDPEENSMRGVAGIAGGFVFKRDEEFVRFYPAPRVVSARTRWKFVTASVLDRVRQQAWSSKRIFKRIKDRKRFVELTLTQHYYGRFRSEYKDLDERFTLFPGLYEADTRFYRSLFNLHLIKTTSFEKTLCCNCFAAPAGSMIVCLECHDETGSMGLCSKPECVNCTRTFEQADQTSHLPTHGMIKVNRFVFDAHMAEVKEVAKPFFSIGRERISGLDDEGENPECIRCKTRVSPPCWHCLECQEEVFICDDCGHRNLALDEGHTKAHIIVRIYGKVEKEKPSTEERLELLESKLERMEQTLAGARQTLTEVRESLGTLVERSAGWSRGEPLTKDDLRATVVEVGFGQPEGEPGTTEIA